MKGARCGKGGRRDECLRQTALSDHQVRGGLVVGKSTELDHGVVLPRDFSETSRKPKGGGSLEPVLDSFVMRSIHGSARRCLLMRAGAAFLVQC